ncbi:MAG TPA: rhodanese-like domain-containing protein [Rubrivivax sp.]|nr:rhodanese-like domain-containing protein [Rubrivivax sp.]
MPHHLSCFTKRLLGAAAAALVTAVAAQGGAGAAAEQMVRFERQDFGVPPTRQLHDGAMHAPTPASIPGGQVVTTAGLVALLQGRQAPYLVFDVLGGPETLPGAVAAVWMSQPGSFDDATQRQAGQLLGQLTQGRKDVVLVFYCLSRECWMSYNAALRALRAGYTNVLWYRGGIEAWKQAGLPTAPAQQGGGMPAMGHPPAAAGPQASQRPPGAPGQPGLQVQPGFQRVTPVAPPARPAAGNAPGPGGELRIGQTQFFSYAQPPGWRIGEQGQFALTQIAPDNRALTLLVGNAGMPVGYPPDRFAYEKLAAMQPQNLQLGAPQQAAAAAGFRQAVVFPVSYMAGGVAYRGVAKVSIAPAYDSATMALTAALSAADQWSGYAAWLPQVAELVSATNGAAFGARGVMAQNLRNSTAYSQAAQEYRNWSQQNWQGVVDARNQSVDRRNAAVRENLGGVQTYADPYGGAPRELPLTNKYYWVDRQGQVVGTDDPGANPNAGSTGEWRRMERVVR